MQSAPLVCPLCQRNDLIRKVSAIYHEGIASGVVQERNVFGMTVGMHPTQTQSNLSARLSPPLPPGYQPPRPNTSRSATLTIILVALVFCPALIFLPLLVLGLPAEIAYYQSSDRHQTVPPALLWLLFAGLVAMLFAAVFLRWFLWRRSHPSQHTLQTSARYAQYREALQRWEAMYYCSRDDVVFLPGSAQTARPEERYTLW